MTTTAAARSWWGWGREDEHLDAGSLEAFGAAVADQFGLDGLDAREPADVGSLELPAPRPQVPEALATICDVSPPARARHALGNAFRDVVRAFRGRLPAVPDVVALPRSAGEVSDVLDWCAAVDAAVVPFGGGTSVVGGVNVPPGDRPVVTLDTARLSGVVEVDARSRAANIRAGTLGPDIEDGLRPHGLTLRFFPQSWEFSTLGGWIATRAGGHYATRLTHIDDVVEAVSAVTPSGTWRSRRLPASGAGPSPDRLLLGSEGTLGVVTSAWVRLQDRPRHRASASVTFPGFEDGCRAVRDLASSGLHPANCRLLDPVEATLSGVGDGSAAVLLLGFESAHHPVERWMALALEAARSHGGRCPEGPRIRHGSESQRAEAEDTWRRTFLRAPYLRDALVALGMVVETFETAATWAAIEDGFVDAVTGAARSTAAEVCGDARIAVRLTHVYPDGAAPYVTVIAPGRDGDEVAQWDAIKAAVSDRIVELGGAITHHHAVGRDHRPWYDRQRPDPFAVAYGAAKRALDPSGLLNPGVLVDPIT